MENSWKFGCWYLAFALLWTTATATGGFPKGFLNQITESAVVQERLHSRWKWEVWDVVPGTHIFHIYIYNITNPNEVELGAKPNLQEVGPYSYIEHRIKFDVSVNMDLSVNYQRNFTYTFDPVSSKGNENDLVTVLNVPFLIFSGWANEKGAMGNHAVNSLVGKGEGLIKRNIRVGDFGFDGMNVRDFVPFVESFQLPPSKLVSEFLTGRVGIFKLKRGANEGAFEVNSGLVDPSKTGQIIKWSGFSSLPFWYGQSCNDINGTDGTVLARYVSNSENINVFDIDLCRSIDYTYNGSSTFQTIVPTYIFTLDQNLLNDPRTDASVACFCKNPTSNAQNCLKRGLLDVSSCKDGAPFVMSLPHFYNADPSYLQEVNGITPNPNLDISEMVVQPYLGVVIEFKRRLQWNINIQKYENLDYFRNGRFKSIIFPILWNDDYLKLDDDKAELMVAAIANEMGGYGTGLKIPANPILILALALSIVLIKFNVTP